MVNYVGQQLGNYKLIRVIGQGGFADIYLGEHIHLRTQAAIKILQMRLADNNAEAFLQEARMVAHLVHPHIIRVLDFGLWKMVPFLVMDYAPGGTLRQRYMRGVPLPAGMLFPYMTQIASALQYAHNHKLVHRDVKPENMLVGHNHEILLSDFGLALTTQGTNSFSKKEMSGTVTYMAPEQVQGSPRPASDQYSLAIVAYEWLTGNVPFQGSMVEIATQQVMTTPPPLRSRVSTISVEIEYVILKALSKNPLQRFASIQEFVQVLQQACLYDGKRTTANIKAMPRPQLPFETPVLIPQQTNTLKRGAHLPEPSLEIKNPRTPQYQANSTAISAPPEMGKSTGQWTSIPQIQTFDTKQILAARYHQSLAPSTRSQKLQPTPPYSQLYTNQPNTVHAKSTHTQHTLLSKQHTEQPLDTQPPAPHSMKRTTVSDIAIAINAKETKKPVFTGATWIVVCLLFIFLLVGGGMVTAALYLTQTGKQITPTKIQTSQIPTTIATSQETSPITSLYPPMGTTTLTDSLASNQLNWDQGTLCNFVNGSYQISIPMHESTLCYAHGTDYQNFIYQTQMTFVKMGQQFSAGGIAFRGNNNTSSTYYIEIFESGKFSFVVKPGNGTLKVLAGYPQDTQNIPSFHTGLGQSNSLAIVANKNEFTFYVNNQKVFGPIKDDLSSHGMLGIFGAGGQGNNGAEIIFNNVQLWQI